MSFRLLLLLLLAPCLTAGARESAISLLERSRQCLLVTTANWTASHGTLRILERTDTSGAWRVAGEPIPVVVGRSGLAPGIGFEDLPHTGTTRKVEGDGRAPAGAFRLGTAFGFSREAVQESRLPFRVLTPATEAVDDPQSRFYNRLMERTEHSAPDWQSSEKMRRIPEYRLGLVIEYNTESPVPRAGSCFFIHCWKGTGEPGAGCTAMSEANLALIVRRLHPAARPVLAQLPRETFSAVRATWKLGEIAGE